jgi:predicted amidohydrolase
MSAESLHIIGIQSDLIWRDPEANLRHFDHLLEPLLAEHGDVLVLPEMFTTGFSWPPVDPKSGSDAVLHWMQNWADRLNAALIGSIACYDEEGEARNRCWFVPPSSEGTAVHYDKRHLFTLAGEHDHFKAGTTRVEVEFRGFRILLQVCYDLRFPVFVRNDRTPAYDLAVYVANWPEKRTAAWRTLLQARAIENQCFVVGINRSGTDGNGHAYAGDSMIVNFAGDILDDAGSNGKAATLQAALSLTDMVDFRKKLPFLEDADRKA